MATSHRPQTIKQAKAAYKSRGQPSLTEQEKRQLDRAIELDRRAWRTKEVDKRKAEAATKKAEKDRKQREEAQRMRLGSQRRCDRFGYKSSQMHLGAFLGKRKDAMKENLPAMQETSESESFGDDDLDDETLLDAITTIEQPILRHSSVRQTPTATHSAPASKQAHDTTTTHSNPPGQQAHTTISVTSAEPSHPAQVTEDLSCFWDDLDSGTQIARDLAMEEHQAPKATTTTSSKASSFSSGDFDLTIEDMEELDPAPPPPPNAPSKLEQDKKLMPPPPLPQRHAPPAEQFTMSQLESFFDEDIQLTQGDPG